MKKLGTSSDGGLIVEMTSKEVEAVQNALMEIGVLASQAFRYFSLGEGDLPSAEKEESPANLVEPEAPAPRVAKKTATGGAKPKAVRRRKAITKRPTASTNKGRYERKGTLKGRVLDVMRDGVERDVHAIALLLNMHGSSAEVDRVTKTLSAYKSLFRRVRRGCYVLAASGGASPDRKESIPIAPPKVRPAADKTDETRKIMERLVARDPGSLTDDELSKRLHLVKTLGGSDQAGRLEFIKRHAGN